MADGPDDIEARLRAIHIRPPEPLNGPVVLAPYDAEWPAQYEGEAAKVRAALVDAVILLEHVGSTSVPGLSAKPILDIILVVADPADEAAYAPALEAAGYRLHLREPAWHDHRLLKGVDPAVNLHVFGPGCEEVTRMLAFRDWMRRDATDRARYASAKRELARRSWRYSQEYADAKTGIVQEILERALAERGRTDEVEACGSEERA